MDTSLCCHSMDRSAFSSYPDYSGRVKTVSLFLVLAVVLPAVGDLAAAGQQPDTFLSAQGPFLDDGVSVDDLSVAGPLRKSSASATQSQRSDAPGITSSGGERESASAEYEDGETRAAGDMEQERTFIIVPPLTTQSSPRQKPLALQTESDLATRPGTASLPRQLQHPISTMRSGVMRSNMARGPAVSALHQRAAILQHTNIVRTHTLPGMIGVVEADPDSLQYPAGMGRLDMFRGNQFDWLSGIPNLGLY